MNTLETLKASGNEYDFRFVVIKSKHVGSWITLQFRDMIPMPWSSVRTAQVHWKTWVDSMVMEDGGIGDSYSQWIDGKCLPDVGRYFRDAAIAKLESGAYMGKETM